jgi:hypothetical protein
MLTWDTGRRVRAEVTPDVLAGLEVVVVIF